MSRRCSALPLLAILPAICGAEDVVNAPTHALAGSAAGGEAVVHQHSWDMPPITVTGQRGEMREEDRIGSYGQPRWTARRLFTETRAYVIPEGQVQFEYWYQTKDKRGDEDTQTKQIYELEVGLPNRFQLDLYQVWEKEGDSGENVLAENSVELRYALANWDVIPTNPTLYAEYKFANGDADTAEFKLLLADELATRWHWAANAVYEFKLGGDETVSREVIGAISYAVVDQKFAIGAEAKFTWEDTADTRGDYETDQLIGPSCQFRPIANAHIDLAYLVNIAPEDKSSTAAKTTVIFGWEF